MTSYFSRLSAGSHDYHLQGQGGKEEQTINKRWSVKGLRAAGDEERGNQIGDPTQESLHALFLMRCLLTVTCLTASTVCEARRCQDRCEESLEMG